MPGLGMEMSVNGDRFALALFGEVDLAVASQIVQAGLDGLSQPTVAVLVVDLCGVEFMDSTGLSALVQLRNRALATGKDLVLRGVDGRIAKVLYISGLTEVFTVEPRDVAGDRIAADTASPMPGPGRAS